MHRAGRQERHVPPRHLRVQGLDPRQERRLEDARCREPGEDHEGVPGERNRGQTSLRRRQRPVQGALEGPRRRADHLGAREPPPPLPAGRHRVREGTPGMLLLSDELDTT